MERLAAASTKTGTEPTSARAPRAIHRSSSRLSRLDLAAPPFSARIRARRREATLSRRGRRGDHGRSPARADSEPRVARPAGQAEPYRRIVSRKAPPAVTNGSWALEYEAGLWRFTIVRG